MQYYDNHLMLVAVASAYGPWTMILDQGLSTSGKLIPE